MKFVNQRDYPHWLYVTRVDMDPANVEWGRTSTIKSSGCGLCSAVMVADRLLPESKFDLGDAIQLAYDTGANRNKGTSYRHFGPAFAEKLGLDLEMSNDPERLRYCLRTGGAAVLHVKGDREGHVGVFSHGGHYELALECGNCPVKSADRAGPHTGWVV